MVINHHISNVMVPIGLRAAFHGLIGLESSFEAFPENHGLGTWVRFGWAGMITIVLFSFHQPYDMILWIILHLFFLL